ncbi:MAG: M56 family metallopeptidase, partial [Planctomycetota bacterium]
QSSVLIVILLALDLILRRKVRAVVRYCLWMLVLLKLVLPTSLSLPTGLGYWLGDRLPEIAIEEAFVAEEPEPSPAAPVIGATETVTLEETVTPVPPPRDVPAQSTPPAPAKSEPAPPTPITAPAMTWQGLVFLAWLAAVAAMLLLLVQRMFFVRGLVAQSKPAGGNMLEVFERCRRQMGVRRQVGLKLSPVAASPSVCGLFKSIILIPEGLAEKLNSQHLKSILLHEMAHIKRGDLWVSFVQTLLQIAYIYSPLVWVANSVIRKVREQAVDEMVLAAMGDEAEDYPETLLNVSRLTFSRPALSLRLVGVVESKKALTSRIKHILGRPFPKTAKLGILGLTAILVTAAVLLPMAKGQFNKIGWFDRKTLVKFESDDKPEGTHRTVGDMRTYSKTYDVTFRKGERLLVFAELYQPGKPMRRLGHKIFDGGAEPQKLSLSLIERSGKQTMEDGSRHVNYQMLVESGEEALTISTDVTAPALVLDTAWRWWQGAEIAKDKQHGKPISRLHTLLAYERLRGGQRERLRFWMPGHDVTQIGKDKYTILLKMVSLSQLDYLVDFGPMLGDQLLDGSIFESSGPKEVRRHQDQYFQSVKSMVLPLPKLTAHKYYKAGEPITIEMKSSAVNWKPSLEEMSDDASYFFVSVNGKEYKASPIVGPFNGLACWHVVPKIASEAPGKYRFAYGWRSVDVVNPEEPDKVIHFDRLITDEAEFEVVDDVPDSYYQQAYEDGWEDILRENTLPLFTDDMRKHGVSGPLLALKIRKLPFDIAFDIYAQAEGSEEEEPAGQLAIKAGSYNHITGCDRNVKGLTWDNVGDRRWRVILKPSQKAAASHPPIRHYYGREFVTDWLTFERSERFDLHRRRAKNTKNSGSKTQNTDVTAPVLQPMANPKKDAQHPEALREILMPEGTGGVGDFSWFPDSQKIAARLVQKFGKYDSRSVIAVLELESGKVEILSEPNIKHCNPACSPDGRKIAYIGPMGEYSTVWLMDVNGDNKRPIANVRCWRRPVWSPDSKRLVFTERNNDIWVVNADGSGLRQLTSGRGARSQPQWSPDGTQIAFVDVDEIWLMNADGSNQRVLTKIVSKPGYGPIGDWDDFYDWSPDGKQIVCAYRPIPPEGKHVTHDGGIHPYQIWIVNVDGSDKHCLTPEEVSCGHPIWTPDSRHILFESVYKWVVTARETGVSYPKRNIWILDLAQNKKRQLTAAEYIREFVLSPDGTKVVFLTLADKRLFLLEDILSPTGQNVDTDSGVHIEVLPVNARPEFAAGLPNGVTVELLGVCEHPSEGKQWWRPDGVFLDEARRPYENFGGKSSSAGHKVYEVAFQLSGEGSEDAFIVVPGLGMGHGKYEGGITGMEITADPKKKELDFKVGVSSGLWRTDFEAIKPKTSKTWGVSSSGNVKGTAAFGKPFEKDGKTWMTVSHSVDTKAYNVGFVAVGKDGNEIKSYRRESGGGGGFVQITAGFDVALENVKKFRLQTRPYEWAEFKNVSLEPNFRTDVQTEVETSIARFQTAPSQAGADILTSLIDRQAVTPAQGRRILELLFQPKVTKRKAYPLGEAPLVSVERRFLIDFDNMQVLDEEHVWAHGEHQHGGSSAGGNYFAPTPRLINLHPVPKEAGSYEFEIRYKYGCTPDRKKVKPVYQCQFTVPVEVIVVEKEKAEKVTLVSNPKLDESMPRAFSVETPRLGGSYRTSSGNREYTGGIEIHYKDIPHAAAFQRVFRFPDGREAAEVVTKLVCEEPIRLRANSSGVFWVRPLAFRLEQPSEYSGTVILRPDIEAAYKDPEIKSIWNGELRFPIGFTVEVAETTAVEKPRKSASGAKWSGEGQMSLRLLVPHERIEGLEFVLSDWHRKRLLNELATRGPGLDDDMC